MSPISSPSVIPEKTPIRRASVRLNPSCIPNATRILSLRVLIAEVPKS